MPVTDLHLINFINKLDAIRENLHLRTLTARELEEILFNGFSTTDGGAGSNYNPVFSGFKAKRLTAPWRNTRRDNYTKKKFEFNYGHHLTVICDKERSQKFRLSILKDFNFIKKNPINVLYNIMSKGITSLFVNKVCFTKEKLQKLYISLIINGYNSDTLNINTNLYSQNYTPISVKLWIKRNLLSKLGVFITAKCKIRTRVSDGSYLYDDVGSISDIEMLDIIKDVETIYAIRH